MPKARWNGPFDAMLPDRRMVRVGDIVDISDLQAESGHWQVVKDSPPAAVKAPADKTSDGGDD